MQLKMRSDTICFNTMPSIGDKRPLPTVDIATEPDEILPEGCYQLEVRLRGPNGQEYTATTHLVVDHIA